MTELPDYIRDQILSLDLERSRPLIISDADEVLFKFTEGLERYLNTQGLWLDLTSFALTGNVKYQETNEVFPSEQMKDLLHGFFAEMTVKLEPVAGAPNALASLSDHAQIVILSNLPESRRKDRTNALARHGMPYPVVANEGLKGPACRLLADQVETPIIFLDDIPFNITSVRESVANSTIIHFVADPRLAKMLPPSEACDHRIDTWPEAHDVILKALGSA